MGHNGQVALLLCDVDRMRYFNNASGYDRGDAQLRRIARDLQREAIVQASEAMANKTELLLAKVFFASTVPLS
ncbi:MAG: diguanylate cyclase, partial [Verrucomicrobiaceae bacterium]